MNEQKEKPRLDADQKAGERMEHSYRRFVPSGTKEEMDRFVSLVVEKKLSREDLKLILKAIRIRKEMKADGKQKEQPRMNARQAALEIVEALQRNNVPFASMDTIFGMARNIAECHTAPYGNDSVGKEKTVEKKGAHSSILCQAWRPAIQAVVETLHVNKILIAGLPYFWKKVQEDILEHTIPYNPKYFNAADLATSPSASDAEDARTDEALQTTCETNL